MENNSELNVHTTHMYTQHICTPIPTHFQECASYIFIRKTNNCRPIENYMTKVNNDLYKQEGKKAHGRGH